MAKKKQKVKAIMGFYDKEGKTWREKGDEWEVTSERHEVLKGGNPFGIQYVEVVNGNSAEKDIGSDSVREQSEA